MATVEWEEESEKREYALHNIRVRLKTVRQIVFVFSLTVHRTKVCYGYDSNRTELIYGVVTYEIFAKE